MKQLENELIINCKKINKNRNVFICVCKMAGHIFFVHTLSQKRCKTNLVLFFFFLFSSILYAGLFSYIYYNEPFFDSDNGGFGDIFRKKILLTFR